MKERELPAGLGGFVARDERGLENNCHYQSQNTNVKVNVFCYDYFTLRLKVRKL